MIAKEDDKNVELTNRINADLRTKSYQSQETSETPPDPLDDPEYLKEFEKTHKFTWIWFVLIALAIASLVFIVLL